MAVLSDSRQSLQDLKIVRRERPGKLAGRTFPQHKHVQRIPAGLECFVESCQQGHDEDGRRDGQSYAKGGHHGQALAQLHITDVVADGDRHRCFRYPMWRRPSTIFNRDAL